ncbi:hypothetical protein A3Q56_07178 [Intoshia linei]|uniref:Uncharacterized protein n=1 Tax=Intoshia linei TaxID=1819745 RepID=A0A177ASY5_9BILA|nr:hypothetical protein A3Q56_07178 [Intoshia linei]
MKLINNLRKNTKERIKQPNDNSRKSFIKLPKIGKGIGKIINFDKLKMYQKSKNRKNKTSKNGILKSMKANKNKNTATAISKIKTEKKMQSITNIDLQCELKEVNEALKMIHAKISRVFECENKNQNLYTNLNYMQSDSNFTNTIKHRNHLKMGTTQYKFN